MLSFSLLMIANLLHTFHIHANKIKRHTYTRHLIHSDGKLTIKNKLGRYETIFWLILVLRVPLYDIFLYGMKNNIYARSKTFKIYINAIYEKF